MDSIRNEVLEYCPLQCPQADHAYVLEKPSATECGPSSSFGVVRRRNDWFLWRFAPCDGTEATFRLACSTAIRGAKKHPKLPMEKKEKKEDQLESDEVKEVAEKSEERDIVEVKESGKKNELKESFNKKSEQQLETVEKKESSDNDELPLQVDLLLKAMFPSYRRTV